MKIKWLSWGGAGWATRAIVVALVQAGNSARSLRRRPGVYGVPPGGLPLAVGIAQLLGVRLLKRPRDRCIWIDAAMDGGSTWEADRKKYKRMLPAVWIGRYGCPVHCARIVDDDLWVVFPWESAKEAPAAAKNYAKARAKSA